MRTSILALALASLFCTTVAFAAPNGPKPTAPGLGAPKGVGPNVFKKGGLPAIKLSKVSRVSLPRPAAAPDAPPQWVPPPTPPLTGELQFDVAHPSSGAIGMAAQDITSSESVARFDIVPGYHFAAGQGKIGIWLPSTAINGLEIVMSCHGDLPSKMAVVLHEMLPSGGIDTYIRRELMELHNVDDDVAFYLDVGTLGPASMVWLQLQPITAGGGDWRVDRCGIKPV